MATQTRMLPAAARNMIVARNVAKTKWKVMKRKQREQWIFHIELGILGRWVDAKSLFWFLQIKQFSNVFEHRSENWASLGFRLWDSRQPKHLKGSLGVSWLDWRLRPVRVQKSSECKEQIANHSGKWEKATRINCRSRWLTDSTLSTSRGFTAL